MLTTYILIVLIIFISTSSLIGAIHKQLFMCASTYTYTQEHKYLYTYTQRCKYICVYMQTTYNVRAYTLAITPTPNTQACVCVPSISLTMNSSRSEIWSWMDITWSNSTILDDQFEVLERTKESAKTLMSIV